MTVSGENCYSCHQSMDSWDFTASGLTFHEAFAPTEDCTVCHNPNGVAAAKDVVTEFHDGLETERVGIIYGGEDLSVSRASGSTWKIDSVVDDKTNLKINWSATYDKDWIRSACRSRRESLQHDGDRGCAGVLPVCAEYRERGHLQHARSYAQGDDYVLGQANAPGQAAAVNLSTTKTVCAANVVTTTIPVDAAIPAGTRAIAALQGKPQLPVPAGMSTKHWTYPLLFVRVPTPTYEFIVGTGAKATTPRREIADTGDCLKCHVGSLYQHGNTRVDNVTMCIICHNSASSDQNNRTLMGANASEAYDGKVGQTNEPKTTPHAIHSAGLGLATTTSIGPAASMPGHPKGRRRRTGPPGRRLAAAQSTRRLLRRFTGYTVFGADPAVTQSCQTHNLYHPTYPRAFNDCAACRKDSLT